MDKQRKKQAKNYITCAVIAVVVLVLAVMPLLASQNAAADGPQASILSTQAELGSIDTQIIGGGQLSSDATMNITIPEAVKLTEYLVGNGDIVSEGDPIARVDKVTVMTALAEVQETLDYLSEELADASSDSESDEVTAHAGGLVKAMYAREGDSVREVMLEYGALAVLSLDGKMAVEIQRDTDLDAGDTVCVYLSDDTEVEGEVESAVGGVLTVTIEDEGYDVGESVIVKTEDGTRLGSGELYIHNTWNATAYYGTVSSVKVSEGDTLSAGKTMFELEISDYSASFQILAAQRQKYEDMMQELFTMYSTGFITAPCDGIVTGVDTDGSFLLAASEEESGWVIQWLANTEEEDSEEENPDDEGDEGNTGDGGDEEPGDDTDDDSGSGDEGETTVTYTVLVGQVTADADGVLILNAYPETVTCTSLSEIRVDTSLMTASISRDINGTVIWETDLTTAHADAIETGDILYFVTDSDGNSYVVWAGNQSGQSGGAGQQTGGMSGSMGSMGSMAGGMSGTVSVFEPYSLDALTIASVTSQEEMTLEIIVDEQDIAKLYTGQEATITVEALTGQSFPAVITSIGNTGTNEGGSSKFTAKLALSKSGDMLPGMNASAYLTLATAENVLTIPTAALVEEGTKTVVYTGYDEKNEVLTDPVEVTTGASNGETTEILSGLTEGDTIYYAYYDTLEISNAPDMGGFGFSLR